MKSSIVLASSFAVIALVTLASRAQADPQLTSWFTSNSGQYARIYASTADETAATRVKSATWSRGLGTQSSPTYSDVNEIAYSANWVYIRTTGLASHMMGPWPANFPNFPANTATIYRIPRVPTIPTTKTRTGLGAIGRFVNGVSFFDNRDAFSYVNSTNTETNPGDGIWSRDAYVNELATFDPALAHQAGNNYHYHAQPVALRSQLGDHVTYNATTNRYTEAVTTPAHSPIIAWAADGFPVYGPYGYSNPTSSSSGVRLMVSGYVARNGSNGTTNLTTAGRHTLPAWAAVAQNNRSTTLATTEYGPDVSTTYPLGRYIEDNDFLGDLGFTQTNDGTVRDFDLDKYNGRTCVTPEFPSGTYAYFTTITSGGTPVYPYNIGRQYYGNPTGGATTIGETVTTYFIGGANTPLTIGPPSVSTPNVTLTWSSVEGGTYTVDASSNQSTWTSKATSLVASSISTSSTYATLASSGTEYGRVNRTAVATYDPSGQTTATVAQSTVTSYNAAGVPNTSPTISNITVTPSTPNSSDPAVVTASIAAPAGRTISNAQLTYTAGTTSSTVFNETMATAAIANWTGTGTTYPWTISFGGPPQSPFNQTAASNHTASGQGGLYGVELIANSPNIANSTMTTTNAINATGTSGTVTFWVASSGLSGTQGWDLQVAGDGTNFTTRTSELAGSNHAYQQFSYTLLASERTSTLKLRFRFAGPGGNTTPRVYLDDVAVVIGGTASPVNVTMYDDGTHGDGAAGDGVYGASIPAQTTGSTVTYTIAATDSTNASTTSGSNAYTTVTGVAAMSVTPSGGLTSSGSAGGAFAPASASFTITNSGTAALNWTAGKTQSWLTLGAASGTLAVGKTATVTATINSGANGLPAGSYSDTVTFTNSTNGSGNTTRAVALTVNSNTAPAAPTLAALSAFTQGTAKTIAWSAVPGATGYTLQISATSNFSAVLASQAVTGTSVSVSNLADGVTYYYRLLATNNIGSSGYSNVVSSTQDNTAPAVAITSPTSGISTATASIVVSGTASDATSAISKVTVNGVTATTANNFATWTITVPLGFGTNGLTAVAYDGAGNVKTTVPVTVTLTAAQTYNPLVIPEVITGTTFNLNLHPASKQFLSGATTTTYAFNNMLFWGPTLIMNKGDWVQMNVTNNLPETTTTHWHGFHIPAIMDGGPRQTIPAGTTWSPSFKVDNSAGTYWYHPHLHQFTQDHLTHGGGGFIIIRDPIESALNLPRTYGVDDLPLALTSRRFAGNQFVTTNSAYGDQPLTNGVLNAQVTLPKQYVRLRVLNAEIERSYNLGFSDNRTFHVIATDGGLVDAPIATTRVVMGVGERVEILVDLSGDTIGSTLDLMSYNNTNTTTPIAFPTALKQGYPGGEAATAGQFGSLLNNTDFRVLHINIGAATANPVTTRPTTLTTNVLWTAGNVTNNRTLNITGGTPGTAFTFDNLAYSANVINQTLDLGAIEKWTIVNSSPFSHSFHIHDVQFSILSRTGGTGAVANYEVGWKDTVYVQQNSSVSFIAKFDAFASNTNPFMYHCHFLNHEDEGTMGQFLVVNNAVEDLAIASFTRTGSNSLVQLDFKSTPGTTYVLQYSPNATTGSWIDIGSVTSDGTSASFIETDTSRLGQARGFYRVTIPTVP
jgi:FtsP/CotA-like multicopper oxidase with cupredoxin domain